MRAMMVPQRISVVIQRFAISDPSLIPDVSIFIFFDPVKLFLVPLLSLKKALAEEFEFSEKFPFPSGEHDVFMYDWNPP